MINGRTFDWESIRIDTVWGLNLEILAVSYSTESPTEAVYGRGRAPRGFGRGNLVQEASIELPYGSFDTLMIYAAVAGGLFNIKPFPITVSYSNSDRGIPRVDVLPSCSITRKETDATQGDTEIRKARLTLNVLDPIILNGVPVL